MIYTINPKYAHVKGLVDDIERHLDASENTLYDQRNLIRVVNFEGHDYVVKSFKKPNLINRIAYRYFRASKAKRSYDYSIKIGASLTPEPVAYIEKVDSFVLTKSYYISRYFDYDHTIDEVLRDKTLDNRDEILKEFSDFTYRLHEQGILHQDYSHGNILIKKSDSSSPASYEFKIIDINRMKFQVLDLEIRLTNFARIRADDKDMETIIVNYAKRMGLAAEELLVNAKFYRDDFYRKRALNHKLRGKSRS